MILGYTWRENELWSRSPFLSHHLAPSIVITAAFAPHVGGLLIDDGSWSPLTTNFGDGNVVQSRS